MPVYFDGMLYFAASNGPIRGFAISDAKISSTPVAETADSFGPDATPSVSANGTDNGILWFVQNTNPGVFVLFAYDAKTLGGLYNSNMAANGRDQLGGVQHFIPPTIANGKVFVSTPNGVAVFGLLTH